MKFTNNYKICECLRHFAIVDGIPHPSERTTLIVGSWKERQIRVKRWFVTLLCEISNAKVKWATALGGS